MPEIGDAGVQDATGTLLVLLGVQVVVTQLLPTAPAEAEQVATGTLVVVTGVQLTVV